MKKFDYSAVKGHETIINTLREMTAKNKVVSAYLFAGEEGIGKKTLAMPFVASLLCEHPHEGAPCLTCPACTLLLAGNHPDFIQLEKPKDKKSIGIEIVREEIIKEAYVRPFSASRKVFLIENSELLTQEAQNALLKVLEEPPAYVVFILLTTAKDALLETVRSRCVKLQLLPVSRSLCDAYFTAHPQGEEGRRHLAASFCQGNIGKGEKMLTDDEYFTLYQNTLSLFSALIEKKTALYEIQQFFQQNKEQIDDVIDFMLVFLRDCLISSITKEKILICVDHTEAVQAFYRAVSPAGIVHIMEAVIHFRTRLEKNANYTLAGLELLTKMQEEIHD